MQLSTVQDTGYPSAYTAGIESTGRHLLQKASRPPIILLLITIALFWKLTLTQQYTWMDHPDMVSQVLPWFQLQAREWHAGHVPLWDPHHRGGQSLIGQVQPGAAYPLNWIFFHLPLKDGFVSKWFLNWYFVLLHYLAGLFMYLLARYLGRSETASLIAGIVFCCGGYLGDLGWPQMLNSAIWSPLVLLFTLRSMDGVRTYTSAALSGLFLGMAFLAGHHQIPIFLAILTLSFWSWRIATRPREMRRRAASAALLLLLAAFLSASFQILPAQEYGKLAYRWVNAKEPVTWKDKVPHNVHSTFSMTPTSLLGLVFPGIHNHTESFAGIVVIVLAMVSFGSCWNCRGPCLFLSLAIGGVLLALGSWSVFHGVLYALIPNFDKARNPSTALYFVTFGLAGLSAYGFDVLQSEPGSPWLRRVLLGLAIFIAALWTILFVLYTVRPAKELEYEMPALTALNATLCLGLFCTWRAGLLSMQALRILAVLLVVFQFGQRVGAGYTHEDDPGYFLKRMHDTDDVARFLRSQPGPFRIEVNQDDIPFYFGDWHGFDETHGAGSVMVDVFRAQGEDRYNALLGRRYYIGRKPPAQQSEIVFESESGVRVYRFADAFPRAWTVHHVVRKDDPGLDLRQTAFLKGSLPQLDTCSSADRIVRWATRAINTIELDVDMGCRGLLVVADAIAPGWKVSVDRRPAALHTADGFLRGVVIPQGTHRVRMTYAPLSVYLGFTLTVFGFVLPILTALAECQPFPKAPILSMRPIARFISDGASESGGV